MQKHVNLVDLVKSFPTNFLAKIGFDTAENEPFNFHNFSSFLGFNFHRGVVSACERLAAKSLRSQIQRGVKIAASGGNLEG